jgi:murein DD-endopeptidase MepM/ murein hydrolase activator NlpD
MKIGSALLITILMAALLALAISLPAHAGPAQQQFATNTPLPDGRILYKIQAGDTCTKIQLLYGVSFEELRQLNQNINADCTNIIEGQEILVGTGGPAAAPSITPGPSPTAGIPTPTPTPLSGTTEICVLLFDDLNGDALRQPDEAAIAGGAISVTETHGKYSETRETAPNPDPTAYGGICFSDVPEGEYNIGAAIPDNYNPTMSLTYTLNVRAGDTAFVDFGAQSREAPAAQSGDAQQGGSGSSPILGILGGLLLLGGIGLGWFALRLRNPSGRFRPGNLLRR